MKVISVGCSFTAGLGVGVNDAYTKHLSDLLHCQWENYGESGHSNKYIFRKTIELLEKWNKNDVLLVQWTNPIRDEIITKEGYLFYPPYYDWFSLRFKYKNGNIDDELKKVGILDRMSFQKNVAKKKEESVLNYCNNFFNKEYQNQLSFCYQLSLFGLLETMGIKYIMFFGWKFDDYENNCKIFNFTNEKFLKETFGSYTNTIGNEHPNLDGHIEWSKFLYSKIKQFNYNKTNLI